MSIDLISWNDPLYDAVILLIDLLAKGSLIITVAGLLTVWLHKSAAASRHIIWIAAFTTLLCLPAIELLTPGFSLSLFSNPFDQSVERGAPLAAPATEELSVQENDGLTTEAPVSDLGDAASLFSSAPDQGDSIIPGLFRLWTPIVEEVRQTHWTHWMLWVWIIGGLAVLLWSVTGIAGIWWITWRASSVDNQAWLDLRDELTDRLGLLQPVRILFSTQVLSPVTWGAFRPVVLLPVEAEDWEGDRRRHVLMHEMAHIKRYDCLTLLIAQLACAIHWFNPFIWRAMHRMRVEQEKASDDVVLANGMRASEYAMHLVDVAHTLRMSGISPLHAIAMARHSHLEGRVIDILDPERRERAYHPRDGLLTACIAFMLMLPLGALMPWQTSDDISKYPEAVAEGRGAEKLVLEVKDEPVLSAAPAVASDPVIAPSVRMDELDIEVNMDEVEEHSVLADTTEKEKAKKRAIAALRNALEDPDREIRRHALMALAEMEDIESAEAIAEMAKTDPESEVRRYALMALHELGPDVAFDHIQLPTLLSALEDEDGDIRRHALMLLIEHDRDPRIIDVLIEALSDQDPDVRRFAVMGLAEQGGDKAMQAVYRMVEDADEDVRRYAIMAISEHADEEAIPVLEKALEDESADVRRFAVMALTEIGGSDALPSLRPMLFDEAVDVRRHVVMAIAEEGNRESIELLTGILLEDPNEDIRKYAALGLGEIGHIDAVDALTQAMQDSSAEVRRYAAMALSEIDY